MLSIITLGILHIRDNRTPQITHVLVIKAERVFGDVNWDGLQRSLMWGAPSPCSTKSHRESILSLSLHIRSDK